MLTFEFTGVDGRMTESEILTSGMVGKEIQILFDDSWSALSKTVVFRSGETCRSTDGAASPVTIPEDVLARPFRRLYVGVYGTDETGNVVIPTIMAEGPMIRYGADPMEDSTAEDLPVWKNLQDQIGDLTKLDTHSQDSLVSAVNELHSQLERMGSLEQLETDAKDTLVAAINEIHRQPGTGASTGTGLSETAAALLIEILRHAVFDADQSGSIDALEAELGLFPEDTGGDVTPDEPEEPVIPEVTLTSISATYSGGDVPVGTALSELTGITVTAHYSDGTTKAVTGYSLSGTIAEGKNTVTVSYEGKTAVFSVTGIASEPEVTMTGISVTYSGGDVPVGTALSELTGITVTAHYSDGINMMVEDYTLSGTITEGQNTVTVSYEGKTAVFTVTGFVKVPVVDQTETLELVYASSYPNVTTFAYTEATNPGTYLVAKRGSLAGGELRVDYDPTVANKWNLNLYAFDADGQPYLQTDKSAATGAEQKWGETEPAWEAVGAGAGFGFVTAPFTVQIPQGCTFIACMRLGSSATVGGTTVTNSSSSFCTWAKDGGITFTVTTYQ